MTYTQLIRPGGNAVHCGADYSALQRRASPPLPDGLGFDDCIAAPTPSLLTVTPSFTLPTKKTSRHMLMARMELGLRAAKR